MKELFDSAPVGDWGRVAETFANEVRTDAIPWAHKALDEVGAARGPDIAGRIRALSPKNTQEVLRDLQRERSAVRAAVALYTSKGANAAESVHVIGKTANEQFICARTYEAQRDAAVKDVEDAHVALNDARVYGRADMPLSDRVKMLAARCNLLEATANNYAKRVHGLPENARDAAASPDPARLTENALNACKAFGAPTDPSDAVAYLAGLLNDSQAARDELRAIIVEAIKGAR